MPQYLCTGLIVSICLRNITCLVLQIELFCNNILESIECVPTRMHPASHALMDTPIDLLYIPWGLNNIISISNRCIRVFVWAKLNSSFFFFILQSQTFFLNLYFKSPFVYISGLRKSKLFAFNLIIKIKLIVERFLKTLL